MTIVFNNPHGSPSRELPIDDTVVVDIDSRRKQVLASQCRHGGTLMTTVMSDRQQHGRPYGHVARYGSKWWSTSQLNDMEDANLITLLSNSLLAKI